MSATDTVTIPRQVARNAHKALDLVAATFQVALDQLPDTEGPRKRNVLGELIGSVVADQAEIERALKIVTLPPVTLTTDGPDSPDDECVWDVNPALAEIQEHGLPLVDECLNMVARAARTDRRFDLMAYLETAERQLKALRLLLTVPSKPNTKGDGVAS